MKTLQLNWKSSIKILLAFIVILSSAGLEAQQLNSKDALLKLKQGNNRFANGESMHPNLNQQRRNETNTKGQHPFATIIACSDSRVPVELVFDAGIGDIFSIRIAGNVCDTDEIGSIEYGVEHLHTPVLIVLGHTSCGAVTAVTRGDKVHGSIPALVDNIIPAVEYAKHEHGSEFSEKLLNAAIENNVRQAIKDLLRNSSGTKELVKGGKLIIEGGIYDLHSGKVKWLELESKQDVLLSSSYNESK